MSGQPANHELMCSRVTECAVVLLGTSGRWPFDNTLLFSFQSPLVLGWNLILLPCEFPFLVSKCIWSSFCLAQEYYSNTLTDYITYMHLLLVHPTLWYAVVGMLESVASMNSTSVWMEFDAFVGGTFKMCLFNQVRDCYFIYNFFVQEAISTPWKNLPRKTAKLYFCMRGEDVFYTRNNKRMLNIFFFPKKRYWNDLVYAFSYSFGLMDPCVYIMFLYCHLILQSKYLCCLIILLQYWKIMNHLKGVALARQHFLIYLQFWLRGRTCVKEWYSNSSYHLNLVPSAPNVLHCMVNLQSFNESQIPTALIERLVAAGKKEHPPVCAILGGILGQVCSGVLF